MSGQKLCLWGRAQECGRARAALAGVGSETQWHPVSGQEASKGALELFLSRFHGDLRVVVRGGVGGRAGPGDLLATVS